MASLVHPIGGTARRDGAVCERSQRDEAGAAGTRLFRLRALGLRRGGKEARLSGEDGQ